MFLLTVILPVLREHSGVWKSVFQFFQAMQTERNEISKKLKDLNNHEKNSTKFCRAEDYKLLVVFYIDENASEERM